MLSCVRCKMHCTLHTAACMFIVLILVVLLQCTPSFVCNVVKSHGINWLKAIADTKVVALPPLGLFTKKENKIGALIENQNQTLTFLHHTTDDDN